MFDEEELRQPNWCVGWDGRGGAEQRKTFKGERWRSDKNRQFLIYIKLTTQYSAVLKFERKLSLKLNLFAGTSFEIELVSLQIVDWINQTCSDQNAIKIIRPSFICFVRKMSFLRTELLNNVESTSAKMLRISWTANELRWTVRWKRCDNGIRKYFVIFYR